MTYRFVHAADIHLDSPLRSLSMRDPALADIIGAATRRAFMSIVDLCLQERVDALLLAGDLYDGEQTSMKTARFLAEQLSRLHQAGVATFIIRGNHDALSKITKELVLPESVHIFGAKASVLSIDRPRGAFPVAIHGVSFAQPKAPESLLPLYRDPLADTINIGLMHTSLAGAPGHDLYAPTSIADLQKSGFAYWALGHIHKRSVDQQGPRAIVMPGMPQGRDINEAGLKSVSLVAIKDDCSIHIEERATSQAQFERIAVDLTGLDDLSDAMDMIAGHIADAREKTSADHLIGRVRLYGATSLAWRLRRDSDVLKTELDARADLVGKSWIEKVEIDCAALDVSREDREAKAAGSDPILELRRLMSADVLESDAFLAEIKAIGKELLKHLPGECRGAFGRDEADFDAMMGAFAREGVEDIVARLKIVDRETPIS